MSPEKVATASTRSRGQDDAALKKPRRDNVRMLRYSGLPRALSKHVGPEADAYKEYLLGLIERFSLPLPLPRALIEPVREAGSAHLDLWRLRQDAAALRARRGGGRRPQEERKIRGEIRKTRIQRKWLEREVAMVAAQGNGHKPSVDELLRRVDEAHARDMAERGRG